MNGRSIKMSLRKGASFVIVVMLLGAGAWYIRAQVTAVAAASQTPAVGPLDYPVDAKIVRNPWLIKAAGGWPSMKPEDISKNILVPSDKQRRHFEEWVRGTVRAEWLSADFQQVPFLAGKGFIYVQQNSNYRVRIREAEEPFFTGSSTTTKAIVIAVEPLSGAVSMPRSQEGFLSLLRCFLSDSLDAFLNPASLGTGDNYHMPPVYQELPEGTFLALYPKSKKPIQLYAWTDGRILLVALYQDVQYKDGPSPPPQVEPTPPPPLGEEHR